MGAEGVREMMEMTPCDIFGYIRGRTVWLVGDSMMQVRCNCYGTSLITQRDSIDPSTTAAPSLQSMLSPSQHPPNS